MNADKVISEARARIIWGESASSVRDFLISNGFSDAMADTTVREFVVERHAEIRGMGIRNILIGALLSSAAGVTTYMAFPPLTIGFTRGYNLMLGAVMVAGIYGLWKLAKGIIYLVRPQSEHKSIPDINQSEIME